MINLEKLNPILASYKSRFASIWKNEKYKWEAIKHFQEHWDIDAADFSGMFKQATDKTSNLLTSGYVYPRGMMTEFARVDADATREMFRNLFDETQDLAVRVEAFQASSEELRAKYDDGTWRNHYQNTNSISTYLWLMYPDKYYIYKYGLYQAAAKDLDADYKPKANGSVESMIGGYKLYDEIREAICKDEELLALVQDALTPACYSDPRYITLTIDFGHYLGSYYVDEEKKQNSNNVYQILAYVKNQDAKHTGDVGGILLYAKTDETITPDGTADIGGNMIGAKTLDLNVDFRIIAAQLDKIAYDFFQVKVT